MGGLCGKEDGGDKKTALRVTNPMLQPDAHHVGKDSDFEDDELEPEPEPGDDGQIAAPGIRPPFAPEQFFNTHLIGRGKDGNIRLLLDKKSPTTIAAWQQRWCVFTPEGKLYYFDTKRQEQDCRVNADGFQVFEDGSNKITDLTQCVRITSDNMTSCHFELHIQVGKKIKVQKFRVHKEIGGLAGQMGRAIASYDPMIWDSLCLMWKHYEVTGVIQCSGDVVDVGKARVVQKAEENILGRKATLSKQNGNGGRKKMA